MAHQFGLCRRNKTGLGTAADPAGETEVRAVAGFGVPGTTTAGLTAFDIAFRERATAHGLRLRQLQG